MADHNSKQFHRETLTREDAIMDRLDKTLGSLHVETKVTNEDTLPILAVMNETVTVVELVKRVLNGGYYV